MVSMFSSSKGTKTMSSQTVASMRHHNGARTSAALEPAARPKWPVITGSASAERTSPTGHQGIRTGRQTERCRSETPSCYLQVKLLAPQPHRVWSTRQKVADGSSLARYHGKHPDQMSPELRHEVAGEDPGGVI